ncbi:MAG TPA: alpha/beta fold hydrolase [bacterium]|nr:alpha/beta fold hydrolase [bacterium]
MRMLIRILIDAVIIIFVLTIIFGWRAIMPARAPRYLIPSDLGIPYEKVNFQTDDGKKLTGWLIHSPKSKSVIICLHGYPSSKSDILPVVSYLYPDFSLLLFDFRAHGESKGKVVYFGLKEYLDVKAAIDFLKNDKRTKNLKIGVWGYSLGASVGIISASKYQEIKCLVSDSAFANFPEMITHYYKKFGPLKYAFSYLSNLLGKIILKDDFMENSPENYIDKVKCPVLIIHSREDDFVPFSHAEILYNKIKGEKELFVLEGSHVDFDARYNQEYRDKVKEFFCKYLNEKVVSKK